MKGDTTRSTFKPRKHYSGVRMQQGRVQLDADWNEQVDIATHRVETETVDVVGKCGGPMHDSGFHVVPSINDLTAEEKALSENQNPPALQSPGDLLISGGRYYVDGILCENEHIVPYTKQSDLPDTQPVTQAGTYLAYLDVWSQHITALEDPQIREVALGGPDSATRSKTVWQVKLFRAGDVGMPATCSNVLGSWNAEIAPGNGKLAARAAVSTPSNDPCIVAPGAGYRRLENQHYRVEVHDVGALGSATFKWSRDNGSIVARWESKDVNELTVSSIGRDKALSFASGQWVELTDDTCELLGKPGTLVQLVKAEGNVLTIDPTTATGPVDLASFPRNPKVRRWDMNGLLKPKNTNWLDLEDGVQIHFTAGTYKTGDYWLIPARTATADVEWPFDPNTNQPAIQLPHGIQHHGCPLALLKFDGTQWISASDCREIFPPLNQLTTFFYVGGDGQEAMPDLTQPGSLTPLAQPLEVGVANGQWPVVGATVQFTVTKGNGKLQGGVTQVKVATGTKGIASCTWSLGSSPNSQQVEATLLNDDGIPINNPIHFTANLSVASQVAYDPAKCDNLKGVINVQDAIDKLCQMGGEKEEGIHITKVFLTGGEILRNDTEVPVAALTKGILVICDNAIDPAAVLGKPTCFVTVEMPVSEKSVSGPVWGVPVIGFHPLILAADVEAKGEKIFWRASEVTVKWLNRLPSLIEGLPGKRILVHLTLKGNFIWEEKNPEKPTLYLDGEAFGFRRAGTAITDLRLPSGDGRRGGDFEMWFWLRPPGVPAPSIELVSLALAPSKITAGETSRGTLKLSGVAPEGGVGVNVQSGDPGLVIVPAKVSIPSGQDNAVFSISTKPVFNGGERLIKITASLAGGGTVENTLTVQVPIG